MAKNPADSRSVAKAAIPASSSQPMTSFTAAAAIATTPTGARVRPNSRRMRPRIGTAVIATATPQNRL